MLKIFQTSLFNKRKLLESFPTLDFIEHSYPIFRKLKILKFVDIYSYYVSSYMRKFHDQFSCQFSIKTRNRHLTVPVFQRLSQTLYSLFFKVPQIWNSLLPQLLKNIDSYFVFKRRLKNISLVLIDFDLFFIFSII